jgi:hypothetical protein
MLRRSPKWRKRNEGDSVDESLVPMPLLLPAQQIAVAAGGFVVVGPFCSGTEK